MPPMLVVWGRFGFLWALLDVYRGSTSTKDSDARPYGSAQTRVNDLFDNISDILETEEGISKHDLRQKLRQARRDRNCSGNNFWRVRSNCCL